MISIIKIDYLRDIHFLISIHFHMIKTINSSIKYLSRNLKTISKISNAYLHIANKLQKVSPTELSTQSVVSYILLNLLIIQNNPHMNWYHSSTMSKMFNLEIINGCAKPLMRTLNIVSNVMMDIS
jgi:uncharacterized protein (DUF2132 family)